MEGRRWPWPDSSVAGRAQKRREQANHLGGVDEQRPATSRAVAAERDSARRRWKRIRWCCLLHLNQQLLELVVGVRPLDELGEGEAVGFELG